MGHISDADRAFIHPSVANARRGDSVYEFGGRLDRSKKMNMDRQKMIGQIISWLRIDVRAEGLLDIHVSGAMRCQRIFTGHLLTC